RERGTHDGERLKAQFNEPGGISATSQGLFVADTNNHLIRRIDLKSGQVSSLELKGLEKLTAQVMRKFRGRVIDAPKQVIGPGAGTITLSFALPAGFKFNQGAPFFMAYQTSDEKAVRITSSERSRNFTEPKFPVEIPVEALTGSTTATIDAVIYFCNDETQKICLVDSVRIQLPLEVKAGAPRRAQIEVVAKAKGVAN
ncbi:MAG: hypothetical protein ABI882_13625, partial [Acidobacteriota bacterium]